MTEKLPTVRNLVVLLHTSLQAVSRPVADDRIAEIGRGKPVVSLSTRAAISRLVGGRAGYKLAPRTNRSLRLSLICRRKRHVG